MRLVFPPSLRLWLFTDAFPGYEAGRQWEHHQRILPLQANVQDSSGKLSLEETEQDRSKLVGLDGEKLLRRRDKGKSRAEWWRSCPLELQIFPAQTQGLNMPCRRENGVRATAVPGALHGSELLSLSSLVLAATQSGKDGGKHLQVSRCSIHLEDRCSLSPEAAGV